MSGHERCTGGTCRATRLATDDGCGCVPGGWVYTPVPFPHPYPSHLCGPGDNGCGGCGWARARVWLHPYPPASLAYPRAMHWRTNAAAFPHTNTPRHRSTAAWAQWPSHQLHVPVYLHTLSITHQHTHGPTHVCTRTSTGVLIAVPQCPGAGGFNTPRAAGPGTRAKGGLQGAKVLTNPARHPEICNSDKTLSLALQGLVPRSRFLQICRC